MVTSDDRVAELIEDVVDMTHNDEADILVRQMSGVSSEYSKWANLQTAELGDQAFTWDKDPFANSKPVSEETVIGVKDHETENMLKGHQQDAVPTNVPAPLVPLPHEEETR